MLIIIPFLYHHGSSADTAKIEPNDVIYELAGQPIAAAADLRREIGSISPGTAVSIKLRHSDGKEAEVTAHF